MQGSLFDQSNTPKIQTLMRAVGTLNREFSRGTVSYAAAGRTPGWKLRSDFKPPHYTTNWWGSC